MEKRLIYSESPYQKMWDTFVYFESEPTTKQFLENIYKNSGFKDSHKYAYQNTSKLIYFIKQAKEYFHSANNSNILVKPLLIYYGMMSLIKTVILTKDPIYPSNTGVLRHGITTRKLKKQNYQFHEDEVKIQKEGLLPWFYSLITNNSIDKIEGNKYKIQELLSLIPELHDSYKRLYEDELIHLILDLKQTNLNQISFSLPKTILKYYQHSITLFLNELNNSTDSKESVFHLESDNGEFVRFTWISSTPISLEQPNVFNNLMIVQDYKGRYYLRPYKESRLLLPDIMVDYMLMYNLGMLCRYDTELWGEIIFSFASEDMYIINEFLNTTQRKFPNLILNILFDQVLIFEGF